MKLYKLTEQNYTTYEGSTKWGEGVTHSVKKEVPNPLLCTRQVIHAYKNVNLGLLLNPSHASITNPVLWEARGVVKAQG